MVFSFITFIKFNMKEYSQMHLNIWILFRIMFGAPFLLKVLSNSWTKLYLSQIITHIQMLNFLKKEEMTLYFFKIPKNILLLAYLSLFLLFSYSTDCFGFYQNTKLVCFYESFLSGFNWDWWLPLKTFLCSTITFSKTYKLSSV